MTTTQSTQYVDGVPTVIGAKYLIPFKVSEMRRAKDSLIAQNIAAPRNFTVRTTHLYVKFSPTSYTQLDVLEADSTLELSAVPKDHFIVVKGSWYRAPNIANDSIPTPHYASVKLGYIPPQGISYQVLDSLYVPDEDVQLMTINPGKAECWYVERLLAEAYRINPDLAPDAHHLMPMPDDWLEYGGGTYTPPPVHGVIRVWDNRLNALVPLEGVKVESRRHFWGTDFRYGYTNADGEYSLSGTQLYGSSNYKIEFWRNGFKVKNNFLTRYDITLENKSRTAFSLDIEWNTYAQFCATIFRAAQRYFYGDIYGLKRPRPGHCLEIRAKNGVYGLYDETGGWYSAGTKKIGIARYRDFKGGTEFYSDEVYLATIHEITHASHHHLCQTKTGAVSFTDISEWIRESWATGVAWYLAGKEYRARGISNYGDETYNPTPATHFSIQYGYQYWNYSFNNKNRSLFINLLDDFNEYGVEFYGESTGSVVDNVTGYSLYTLENSVLPFSDTRTSLVSLLQSTRPSGVTALQLTQLLSFYP